MNPRTKRPMHKKPDSGWQGTLPPQAPLANPYVPFQAPNAPKYEARKGLVRGTMFPGLDLPFMGMVNEKEKPDTILSNLQSLAFAVQELALYLDTHREDQEALEVYRAYQEMLRKLQAKYAEVCGPLNHTSPGDKTYRWLDDPWPWEYCANREG